MLDFPPETPKLVQRQEMLEASEMRWIKHAWCGKQIAPATLDKDHGHMFPKAGGCKEEYCQLTQCRSLILSKKPWGELASTAAVLV